MNAATEPQTAADRPKGFKKKPYENTKPSLFVGSTAMRTSYTRYLRELRSTNFVITNSGIPTCVLVALEDGRGFISGASFVSTTNLKKEMAYLINSGKSFIVSRQGSGPIAALIPYSVYLPVLKGTFAECSFVGEHCPINSR